MAMDEGENTDDLNIEDSRDVIAFLDFGQGNQQLGMKIAISPNSIDGAKANIDAETDGFAFDQIRQDAANAWAETLSKIELEGGTEAEKTNFYTSMYHTYFAPFLYQDVDGQYRGMDGQSYQTDPNRPNYSVYSMWDTFRAAHPLKTITEKERSIEYVHDLINKFKKAMYCQSGNSTQTIPVKCLVILLSPSLPIPWSNIQKLLPNRISKMHWKPH